MALKRFIPPPEAKPEDPPTYDKATDALLINPARLASQKFSRVTRPEESDGEMVIDFAPNWKINFVSMSGLANEFNLLYDLQARVLTEKEHETRLMKFSKKIDDTLPIRSHDLLNFFSMMEAVSWAYRLGGEFREQAIKFLDHSSLMYMELLEMQSNVLKECDPREKYPSEPVCRWWNGHAAQQLVLSAFSFAYASITGDLAYFQKQTKIYRAYRPVINYPLQYSVRDVINHWEDGSSPDIVQVNTLYSIMEVKVSYSSFVKFISDICKHAYMPDESIMQLLRREEEDPNYEESTTPIVLPGSLIGAMDKVKEGANIFIMRGMKLNLTKRRARETVYYSEGTRIATSRLAQAVIRDSTSNLFFQRRYQSSIRGGTVIIDSSGSMGANSDMIKELIKSAPGASVAYYAGPRYRTETDVRLVKKVKNPTGAIVIAAHMGKISSMLKRNIPHLGNGNDVDLDALRWMMTMPRPWYLVSDLQFCGGHESQDRAAHQLVETLQSAKQLTVFKSVRRALEGFAELAENDKKQRIR